MTLTSIENTPGPPWIVPPSVWLLNDQLCIRCLGTQWRKASETLWLKERLCVPRNASASLDLDVQESCVPRALSIPFLPCLLWPELGSRTLVTKLGSWGSLPPFFTHLAHRMEDSTTPEPQSQPREQEWSRGMPSVPLTLVPQGTEPSSASLSHAWGPQAQQAG